MVKVLSHHPLPSQALSRTVEMAATISGMTEESEAKLQRFGDRQAWFSNFPPGFQTIIGP